MFRSWWHKMTSGKARLLQRARRAKPGRARPRKVSLEVQALEDRWLPTVFINPQFGPDQLVSPPENDYQTLSSPKVYLIFWGTAWGESLQSAVDPLRKDFQTILNSPYTSGLTL